MVPLIVTIIAVLSFLVLALAAFFILKSKSSGPSSPYLEMQDLSAGSPIVSSSNFHTAGGELDEDWRNQIQEGARLTTSGSLLENPSYSSEADPEAPILPVTSTHV